MALAVAVLAAIALLASGQGVRYQLWPYQIGLGVMRATLWPGLAAAALALITLAWPSSRSGRLGRIFLALAIALGVSFVPLEFQRRAQSVPRIHDISTDTENPPQFVAVLPLRAGAPNTAAYGGRELAAQQRKGYPDLGPLVLGVPPNAAFARVRDAAESLGWQVVAADAATGRLEATDSTFWFGFKDDIVVRVAPQGTGSRIDVRSVSRVGRSDLGMNARRVRDFLQRVKNF